jgi:NitT/TauT family transport system substrate-binding protein
MIHRRHFLKGAISVGTGALLGISARSAGAEPPPETTTLRLSRTASICVAPQYVAEELLRAEGFADVQSVDGGAGGSLVAKEMAAGRIDICMGFAATLVVALDAGEPLVILGGVHIGCFELFGSERVHTIKDLKGKKVAILALDSAQHVFLASMATQVGLDPRRDIEWVTKPAPEAKQLLAEGKIDAFLGFPPDPQELRVKKIGHVVVNSATDRPWSQYFCCMVAANREFVR